MLKEWLGIFFIAVIISLTVFKIGLAFWAPPDVKTKHNLQNVEEKLHPVNGSDFSYSTVPSIKEYGIYYYDDDDELFTVPTGSTKTYSIISKPLGSRLVHRI